MKYKETQVSGSQWQRAVGFVGYNAYEDIPSITFNEEVRVVVGAETFGKPAGNISETFTDPTKVIPLLAPINGATIATYQDFYVMLQSLYMALVTDRDAAAAQAIADAAAAAQAAGTGA